jgi:predicted component of type VI protein secretion system
VRLVAHRPNRLRDGDEIRLGQMVIKIRFIQPSQSAPTLSGDARS